MSGFTNITKVIIPIGCIEKAIDHLRMVGKKNVEGIALFAGIENENVFKISKTIIPEQNSFNTGEGLLYTVDSDELYKINVWLYENKLSLFAQIHSHPTTAYHSSTDDEYPIIATIGGLSIVVPYFAKEQIDLYSWAIYRLHPENGWVELKSADKKDLIKIIP